MRLPLPFADEPALRASLVAALALHAAALAWVPQQLWQPLPASRPVGSLRVVVSPPPAVGLAGQPIGMPAARPDPGRTAAALEPLPQEAPPVLVEAESASLEDDGTGPTRPVEYLPRERLTRAPQPQAEPPLAFPAIDGLVDLRVRISLYIDEHGIVQQLRLDTPDVPPVFAQAIQAAFGSTRFSPGEVDSVAVPSLVRLEVEFSSRPTP